MTRTSAASKLTKRIVTHALSQPHGRRSSVGQIDAAALKRKTEDILRRKAVWDLRIPIQHQFAEIRNNVEIALSPKTSAASRDPNFLQSLTKTVYDAMPIHGQELASFSTGRLVVPVFSLQQLPPTRTAVRDVEVMFAGRSNVGKSSLLNALARTTDLALTSQKPGKTQSLNFYGFQERMLARYTSHATALARAFPINSGNQHLDLPRDQPLVWKGLRSNQDQGDEQPSDHSSLRTFEQKSLLNRFDQDFIHTERKSAITTQFLSEKQRTALVSHLASHRLALGESIPPCPARMFYSKLFGNPDSLNELSDTLCSDVPSLFVVDVPGYGFAKAPKAVVEEWNKLIGAYIRMRSPKRFLPEEAGGIVIEDDVSGVALAKYTAAPSLLQFPSLGSNLRRVFVLVDATAGLTRNDMDFLVFLNEWRIPCQIVVTKADRVNTIALERKLERLQYLLGLSFESEDMDTPGVDERPRKRRARPVAALTDSSVPFADIDQALTGGDEEARVVEGGFEHGEHLRLPPIRTLLPYVIVVSSHEGEGIGVLRKAVLSACAALDTGLPTSMSTVATANTDTGKGATGSSSVPSFEDLLAARSTRHGGASSR